MKKKRPKICIPKTDEGYIKDLITQTRIFTIIIIAAILISDLTNWIEFSSLKLIIFLMSLLLFAQTFARFLDKNPKAKKIVMWVLIALAVLGIIIFFIF